MLHSKRCPEGQQSKSQRVGNAEGRLGRLGQKRRSRDDSGLAKGNQNVAARQEFPAVAREKSRGLADVVVLGLKSDLHIGRKVQIAAQRQNLDVHLARRETDEAWIVIGL